MDEADARVAATRIAQGHAWDIHVVQEDEFPEVKSPENFAGIIYSVLTDPQID